MKIVRLISILFLLLVTRDGIHAQATAKITISGTVTDSTTGETLMGVVVFAKEIKAGTTTNAYGFFSLTVPDSNYTVTINYAGYNTITLYAKSMKNTNKLNIQLSPKTLALKEAVITGEKSNQNVTSTQMGTVKMEIDEIKKIPVFMGEVDILKTIQLIPGVKSSGDGNSGFYVRGGGPDQNLILLDEAVVYNASHLFGFFSVFNGDAVKNINLIKGGMPAQYGGRLSSVLDINMKEGNNKKFEGEGGIGLISSRLTLQGPIKKDTGSFIISARRTYIDVLIAPLVPSSSPFKGSGYYFYDVNTKLNYRLSSKDRLFLSGYFGRDVFSFKNKDAGFNVEIPWGNATGVLRWNHIFNNKLFMNTSAIFTDYQFEFGAAQSGFEFRLFSGIRDWNAKCDLSFFPNNLHEIKAGGNYIFHTFTPTSISAKSGEVTFDFGDAVKQYAHDAAIYITDDYQLTEKIKLNAGLRYSYFQQVGPFDRYITDVQGKVVDVKHYDNWEEVQSYGGLEPRAALRYTINKSSSVKASYTQNYQYIHLASLSGASLPTDVWVPSSQVVKPQFGVQYALGYFKNFYDDTYETSIETYYKTMENLVEYKDGALPSDNLKNNSDNNFTFGSGESYGAEFFVKKRTGKLTGWIGYTLAWTTRQFDELNRGETFFAKYDRRHDGSVVVTYELNERWTFSAVFVYSTGNAATLPTSRFIYEGALVNQYGDRNSYRLADYHRMDVSATLQGKKRKYYQSNWNFSVFNVYNRMNPYFIYFASTGSVQTADLKIQAKQVSLFPVLPSVTWNFKF